MFVTGLVSALAVAGVGVGLVAGAMRNLPDVERVEDMIPAETSFLYDREGTLITEIHGAENRISLSYDEIPEDVIHAFVAIEDERFFSHFGVDPIGIARAALNNLRGGERQGASTITQQLARNLFPEEIGFEITLRRKIEEALMAIQLERRYPKERILEMYLNHIFLGYNAYGIEAGAQVYFGKPAKDLELHEAAMLAAIVKGPSVYDPIDNPQATLERRNLVLDEMAEQGYITAEEAQAAKRRPLGVPEQLRPASDYPYPHFVDYVVRQVLDRFQAYYEQQGIAPDEAAQRAAETVYGGGLHIYTTLDTRIQELAETAVREVMDRDFPIDPEDDNPIQAAVVTLDVPTGEILAMVGGRQHEGRLDFNRAWQATRQPGSAAKPLFVYAPALLHGWTAGSVVDDAPVQYPIAGSEPYFPRNYNRSQFLGLMTVREALRLSQNVPAVRVFNAIGVETGVRFAQRLGLDTLDLDPSDGKSDLNLSSALGGLTRGVTLLDLAEAYSTFANLGVRQEPYAIRRVVDRYGTAVLEPSRDREQEVVMEPEVAWLMTDLLKNVVYPHRLGVAGTGAGAALRAGDAVRPVAGKTGTTSDHKDVWFVGYTRQLLTAVWIGHDQPVSMQGQTTSSRHPVEIWRNIMEPAHEGLPVEDWEEPQGIVRVRICKQSGRLPGPYCPDTQQYTEVFLRGTEPTEFGEIWKPFTVCQEDPTFLYEPGCTCTPVEQVFLDRPPVEFETDTGETFVVQDAQLAPPQQTCQASPQMQSGAAHLRIYRTSVEPNLIWNAYSGETFTLYATAVEAPARLLIPDFNVDTEIEQGQTLKITFTPQEPGRFVFEVHVDSYRIPGYLVVRRGEGNGAGEGEGQAGDGDDEDGDRRDGDAGDEDGGDGGDGGRGGDEGDD
ncbi:MAG TPA: PBP1A family penicillin-binding protein [Bacillota bacterium]